MRNDKVISAGLALGVGLMLAVGGWADEKKDDHPHPPGTPPHEHPNLAEAI